MTVAAGHNCLTQFPSKDSHPMTATARLTIPDLAGKRVLITGASTGIGAAVALAFAAQGARVAIHYNASAEAAEAVAKAVKESGGTGVLVHGDMSDAATSRRVVEDAAKALGGLDGVINNAGGMLGRLAFTTISDEHYDRVMDLNVRSVFAACQAAIPHLKKAGGGFIINTSSVAARNGGGGGSVLYASAKGFVSTVTHGLAKEFIGSGIRVNAVAPGVIDTPFHERYSNAEQMKAMIASIPQGRAGTSEDCVGVFLFLASEALSGYIVGQVIEVNGGQLMP
jgi:3-oxoacyl-[acyl-carrier protein] reductase